MGLVLLALPNRGIELQMKDLKKNAPFFLGGGGVVEREGASYSGWKLRTFTILSPHRAISPIVETSAKS